MKIAIFEVEDKDRNFFENELGEYELTLTSAPLSNENAVDYKESDIISIRSSSELTQEVLSGLPNLKLICTRTTGLDHIDQEFCKGHNIMICNVPGYGQYTVAEHTFALLLAISRNLIPSVEHVKKGNLSLSNLRGFELHGKTIGVVGAGSIGRAVIKIANAFGMDVIVNTKDPDEKEAKELGYRSVPLEKLFADSDIITLHVPYTPETHYLVNNDSIKKMKRGVILINTARGALIETDALIEGLRSGVIKAAGLDVLENEKKLDSVEKELLRMDNVMVTPHNAFNSVESLQRILSITITNITAFVSGKPQNMI